MHLPASETKLGIGNYADNTTARTEVRQLARLSKFIVMRISGGRIRFLSGFIRPANPQRPARHMPIAKLTQRRNSNISRTILMRGVGGLVHSLEEDRQTAERGIPVLLLRCGGVRSAQRMTHRTNTGHACEQQYCALPKTGVGGRTGQNDEALDYALLLKGAHVCFCYRSASCAYPKIKHRLKETWTVMLR